MFEPTSDRPRAVRAGSSKRSPADDNPPPTTTMSGSRAATRLATPTPSHSPTNEKASWRNPVTHRGGLGDHRTRQLIGVLAAPLVKDGLFDDRCGRGRIGPARYRWSTAPNNRCGRTRRHIPRARPAYARTLPAMPLKPRCNRPSSTRAPPMPVPRVTITAVVAPLAAPNVHSAHAAALASLSSTTGAPQRCSSRARTSSPRQGR